jgi:hypothetical protein
MRTKLSSSSSPSNPPQKLYINSNTLSLRGEGIAIAPRSVVRTAATRHHRIEIGPPSTVDSPRDDDQVEQVKAAKATIKPKECAPLSDDLVSRQVRKIRETVRVEDLERLLRGVTGAGGHARKRAPPVRDLGEVYDEFFGAHYALLREVIRNRMSSIT